MERAGFLLKVRPDKIDEYKERHKEVWPDHLEALSRHGWKNFSLFLADDGQLFGYVEAEDTIKKSLDGMTSEDVNMRWQEFMNECFEQLSGRPDESFVHLEHVFYLS